MAIGRRNFIKNLGASLALPPSIALPQTGAASPGANHPRAKERSPNIVLMICDDLGYGDLQCYGSRLKTPNLNRMASRGMRFTRFNTAHAICSASRSALLTGRYAARTGVPAVYYPHATSGLDIAETTLANLFSKSGYRTMAIGKWHLGELPQYLPTSRGFESFYGVPYSVDMKPFPLYRNQTVVESETDRLTLTPRYTEEAVKFIDRTSDEPFFLYLAFSYPHDSARTSARFRGKSRLGDYADAVEEIDWSVGEIFRALERNNLTEDTIVLFTSDHGPGIQGNPGMLRGRKASTLEGGCRIPFLACWPGRIPAGGSTDAWASNLDVLPTLTSLCRLERGSADETGSSPKSPDGVDISAVLLGTQKSIERTSGLLYFSVLLFTPDETGTHVYDIHCIRRENWKLRVAQNAGEKNYWLPHPELYDLDSDPAESYDCAAFHLDTVHAMMQELDAQMTGFSTEIVREYGHLKQRPADCRMGPGASPVPNKRLSSEWFYVPPDRCA